MAFPKILLLSAISGSTDVALAANEELIILAGTRELFRETVPDGATWNVKVTVSVRQIED